MEVPEPRRSSASSSSSPEFEFWPLHPIPAASPSCADELFSGGVLLPLPVLPPRAPLSGGSRSQGAADLEPGSRPEPGDACILATVAPAPAAASVISSAVPPHTAGGGGSKRWTDIFSKKPSEEKDRERRKDGAGGRKVAAHAGAGVPGGGGSELNINIWPFSRSRSAGGGSGSSKPRPPPRKVSSAPCSRSNSRGEAAAVSAPTPRRWAASPGRAGGGVPVGRSSPVWQIRRPAARHAAPSSDPFAERRAPPAHQHKEKPAAGGRKPGLNSGVRSLGLSVNSCIGYRHQTSCRRADVAGVRAHGGGAGGGGLFGIKGLFSKKVH